MHQHYNKFKNNRLALTIILNIIITLLQIIGGILSNSLALMSDALHNFSDVISLSISYIAQKLKHKKEPDHRHTFGYKRAEIIAAFINSSTLIIISIFILKSAIERIFFERNGLIDPKTITYLSILSIIINALSALLLYKDSKNNLNIESSFLHLFSDMLTSVGVLIGGILMFYFEDTRWIDAIISIAIAIYLIYTSIKILLKTLEILMQFTPKSLDGNLIANEIKKIEGIEDIFHIHIWMLDEREIHFEARVVYSNTFSIKDILEKQKEVEKLLLDQYEINHTILQPEKIFTPTNLKRNIIFSG